MSPDPGYALLDAGDGRRLERFGTLVLDRPAPGAVAPRQAPPRWRAADLRYDAGRGWSGRASTAEPWEVEIAGLTLELRPTSSGGIGLYPEHAANVEWLEAAVRARSGAGRAEGGVQVLNLFAHTGLLTLAAARAGAAVAHVDSARASVAWARRNAKRNGLADHPIRWLVDDARTFTEREGRRGRRYDGVIIDPPSAGQGPAGRWTLRERLPELLAACAAVATTDAFVLLTAHSTGLAGEDLAAALGAAFHRPGQLPAAERLSLTANSGARLDLGWSVRLAGGPPPGGASARNRAP